MNAWTTNALEESRSREIEAFHCILIGHPSQGGRGEIGQKVSSDFFDHLPIPTIKPTAGICANKKLSRITLNDVCPFWSEAVAGEYAASVKVTVNWALCGNLADYVRVLVKESS